MAAFPTATFLFKTACSKKRSSKCARFWCTFGGLDEDAKQKYCDTFLFLESPRAATPYDIIFCIFTVFYLLIFVSRCDTVPSHYNIKNLEYVEKFRNFYLYVLYLYIIFQMLSKYRWLIIRELNT